MCFFVHTVYSAFTRPLRRLDLYSPVAKWSDTKQLQFNYFKPDFFFQPLSLLHFSLSCFSKVWSVNVYLPVVIEPMYALFLPRSVLSKTFLTEIPTFFCFCCFLSCFCLLYIFNHSTADIDVSESLQPVCVVRRGNQGCIR